MTPRLRGMNPLDDAPSKPVHKLIAEAAAKHDAGRRGFVRDAVTLTAMGGAGQRKLIGA
jgi:hypothetical protein